MEWPCTTYWTENQACTILIKQGHLFQPRHVLYESIIAPDFDYCSVIWGTCNQSSFHKVQKLQNRAARISTGVGRYESATAALITMKWHYLRERYEYHLASTTYKMMNNHVPSYLTNRFSVRNSGYNLRVHKNVIIPKFRNWVQEKVVIVMLFLIWLNKRAIFYDFKKFTHKQYF